jgi:hypothetical protein
MRAFTHYVSRRMIAALAIFAAIAMALVTIAAARDAGDSQSSDGADIAAELVDPQAFEAALDDPASAVEAAADDSTGGHSQLRADLKAAFQLEGDARRAALADIRAKAQDGGYGDRIERRADRREIHHQLFLSLLPDNLQADLTELKDAPADQREQVRSDIVDKALAGDYGDDVKKAAEQLQQLRHG